MNTTIAFCGLDCSQCEAYIVTQADDEEGKIKLAQKWRVEYDSPEIDVVSVTCDGCHASERLGG
ncbi:MAG: DUF3795 domain-containing protein, partial [Anaerolineaceae bacterium]|nr:DUF3795 domain-containing protein [Anaerolineaceae bacterium]